MSDARRLLVLASLLLVPWSVQFFPGGFGLRFAWGMASFDPLATSLLVDYLRFGRSSLVFSWLLSAGTYALALVGVLVGALARGRLTIGADDRLVAGLLLLSGGANVSTAWAFSFQPGRIALPVGTLALWFVAWRLYGAGIDGARVTSEPP